MKPIPTRYAGCHFRSRLEARWAVFFDHLGIEWEYEPQGFELPSGRRYLPDFLLPTCGTWIEVKGSDEALDRELIREAARELPELRGAGEQGPRLMLLGPHPVPDGNGAWGWLSLTPVHLVDERGQKVGPLIQFDYFGFELFNKNLRPWWLDTSGDCDPDNTGADWTAPVLVNEVAAPAAYAAARSARFEHGQSGAGR